MQDRLLLPLSFEGSSPQLCPVFLPPVKFPWWLNGALWCHRDFVFVTVTYFHASATVGFFDHMWEKIASNAAPLMRVRTLRDELSLSWQGRTVLFPPLTPPFNRAPSSLLASGSCLSIVSMWRESLCFCYLCTSTSQHSMLAARFINVAVCCQSSKSSYLS